MHVSQLQSPLESKQKRTQEVMFQPGEVLVEKVQKLSLSGGVCVCEFTSLWKMTGGGILGGCASMLVFSVYTTTMYVLYVQ
jgi:hypothetical protein